MVSLELFKASSCSGFWYVSAGRSKVALLRKSNTLLYAHVDQPTGNA